MTVDYCDVAVVLPGNRGTIVIHTEGLGDKILRIVKAGLKNYYFYEPDLDQRKIFTWLFAAVADNSNSVYVDAAYNPNAWRVVVVDLNMDDITVYNRDAERRMRWRGSFKRYLETNWHK